MAETIAASQTPPQSSRPRESASPRGPEIDLQPVALPFGQQIPGIVRRAKMDIRSLAPAEILTLQRTIGNQALLRLIAGSQPLQPKLTLGARDDVYEKEADSVADEVMSQAIPKVHRKCACGGGSEEGCPDCRMKRLAVQRLSSGNDAGLEAPCSPLARLAETKSAPQDQDFYAELQAGNWQSAAEKLNRLNKDEILGRLKQLKPDQVAHIHQGALANPRLGPHSQVAQLTAATPANQTPAPASPKTPASSSATPANGVGKMPETMGGPLKNVQRVSWDDVTNAVSGAGQALQQGVSAVGSAITSGASAAALAAANAIAAPFGGHVALAPSGGIEITIDDIEIAEVENETLVLPVGLPTVTLFEKGFTVGENFYIDAWAGTILGDPSVTFATGPVKLQNIKLLLDPLGGVYSGTAQLYVGAAVSGSLEKATEARIAALGIIPAEPPIPIVASAEAGTRAIFRLVGKGGLTNSISLTYSGGSFVLNDDVDVKLGALAQLDHEAFLRIELEGEEICSVIWPIHSSRLGEKGIDINLPVTVASGPGGKSAKIGTPTTSPIAPDSIPTDLQDEHEPTKCKSLKDLTEFLCKKGLLPSTVCSVVTPPGPTPPVGPGVLPHGPVTPPVGPPVTPPPVRPIPSGPDTCAAPASPGSIQVDSGFFAGSKVNYNSNPKHTKMAQKSLTDLSDIQKRCVTKTPPVTVPCEQTFCTALAKKDAVSYGSQIDSGARARYAELIKAAFDGNNNRYPRNDRQVAMQKSTSPAVGVDIKSGSQTGTYHVIANKPVSGNEFTGAHLVPGNVPPGPR
jgi:hypothetical protein